MSSLNSAIAGFESKISAAESEVAPLVRTADELNQQLTSMKLKRESMVTAKVTEVNRLKNDLSMLSDRIHQCDKLERNRVDNQIALKQKQREDKTKERLDISVQYSALTTKIQGIQDRIRYHASTIKSIQSNLSYVKNLDLIKRLEEDLVAQKAQLQIAGGGVCERLID